jgi:putative copper export protein
VHRVPHVPQLVVLVAMFASQPSLAVPLQSAKPGSQVIPHVPALQVALAFAGTGHAVAHAPQCIGSALRSAHTVSQRV